MKLLGPGKAAEMLGMTISGLAKAVRNGKIVPDRVTIGGHARFTPETIEALQSRALQSRCGG